MARRALLRAGAVAVAALAISAGSSAAQLPVPLPLPLPGLPGSGGGGNAPRQGPPRPDRPKEKPCRGASSLSAPPLGAPVFPCSFPDPMILHTKAGYYGYATSTGWERPADAFPILFSRDLRRWRHVGDAFRRRPRWAQSNLWAPSVLHARGRYFMYYGAKRRRDGLHCLAVATSKRAAGPFKDRGVISCGDRRAHGYIDPAPLRVGKRTYLFFSVDSPRHSISALRLKRSLLRARGRRRKLIGVDLKWQRGLDSETVEAPWPLRRGGRYFLFYSAGCWCLDYRMGYAVARRPLGPYKDHGSPILDGGAGLLAPGSGSVVTTRSGATWLAFHAWSGPPDYSRGGIRTMRTVPLSWHGGKPHPLVAGVVLSLPEAARAATPRGP
jgi:beta-xylosidase